MEFIERYKEHLEKLNYADGTISGRIGRIRQFFRIIKTAERQLTEKQIAWFVKYLYSEYDGVNTIYGILVTLRSYFTYLVDQNLLLVNPMRVVELPKQITPQTPWFSVREVQEILNGIKVDNDSGLMVRAILEVLYSAAIRPGEMRNIRMADVDFDEGFIVVRNTKTRRDRTVPVGKTALGWLNRFVNEVRMRILGELTHDCLFFAPEPPFRPLTNSIQSRVIRYVLEQSGIKPFKLYMLRRSSATHLLESNVPLPLIQELLGHARIDTTIHYLKVSTEELKKVLREYHPANKREWRGHEV